MKLNVIDIKQNQLLTSTMLVSVVVSVALLLFGSNIYNRQIYGHNFVADERCYFFGINGPNANRDGFN
jgi:hypothetical protein